ncbi:aminoglycoside phosphotransferase [Actinoplanes sp. NPDC005259]
MRRTAPVPDRCVGACQADALRRETIAVGPYSVVERLILPHGSTAILKRTDASMFPAEANALTAAGRAGAPVPTLQATCTHADTAYLLMEDLGPAIRPADSSDTAYAAARLHRYGAHTSHGDLLNETGLSELPHRGTAALDRIARKHPGKLDAIRRLLRQIAERTPDRTAGAQLPPFGLCHGELHPSAVHVTASRVMLLDLAVAYTGPGLLDLAAHFGSNTQPQPAAMRHLIHQYVQAGGPTSATANRGGLTAEVWALGWHRVHSAIWHLENHRSASDLTSAQHQLVNALHYFTH